MIVAELIKTLSTFPQDLEVKVYEIEPDTFVPVTSAIVALTAPLVDGNLSPYVRLSAGFGELELIADYNLS